MTTLKAELFSRKEKQSRKIRLISPYPITHRFKVQAQFEGSTLLTLMTTKFPFREKTEWEDRILNGRVYVNDKEVSPDYTLRLQDLIYHHNPRVVEPAVPDEVEILLEKDDYLIVNKPAPMPMHPGGRYNKNSLIEILKEQGYGDLRITHRLDAVTSGVVLFARNKDLAKRAMDCFANAKVKKTYYAEVSGVPEEDRIIINAPIKRKYGFVFETNTDLTKARDAVTHFEVIERYEQSSIIKCNPETGRTHQIRLHLHHWGYPIIDDPIYGPGGDQTSRTMQKRAISLISAGLEIPELGIDFRLRDNLNI